MEFKQFVEENFGTTHNIGDDVWICDFRHENVMEKPIRNVKPQRVRIESNDNLPPRKRVYYADFHFLPYGVNGNVKKQVIAPFDNTGFRGYTGIAVKIFFNETDCREFFTEQCKIVKEKLIKTRKSMVESIDIRLKNLEQEMADNI